MSDEQNHTLGPWHVEAAYGGGTEPLFYEIRAKAGHQIGTVMENECPFDDRPISMEEAERNARLMAAAPDMLEALRPNGKPSVSKLLRAMGYDFEAIAIEQAIAKAT